MLLNQGITDPTFGYSAELDALIILQPYQNYTPHGAYLFVLAGAKLISLGYVPGSSSSVQVAELYGEASALVLLSQFVARIDRLKDGSFAMSPFFHTKPENGIARSWFATSQRYKTQLFLGQPGLAKETGLAPSGDPPWMPIRDLLRWLSGERSRADAPVSRTWYHVTRAGIVAIPGGTLENLNSIQKTAAGAFHEFPEIDVNVIQGSDALYSYDGKALARIPHTEPQTIGKFLTFAGTKAIGRVIFRSERGVFTLSRDGATRIEIPDVTLEDFDVIAVRDWPSAKVVLVATTKGLLAIDQDLHVAMVDRSVHSNNNDNFVGEQPSSGDMIMNGVNSILVVVDTERHGKAICSRNATNTD